LRIKPRNFRTPVLTANRSLRDNSWSHLPEPVNAFFVPETRLNCLAFVRRAVVVQDSVD
jgi:hypothetical protein